MCTSSVRISFIHGCEQDITEQSDRLKYFCRKEKKNNDFIVIIVQLIVTVDRIGLSFLSCP